MTTELTKRIDRRIKILLAVFALWLAAVLAMLFNIGVFNQAEYLRRGDDISVRQFFVHPNRASILDCNGRPLAWSEIHYDLQLSRAAMDDPARSERIFKLLSPVFPDLSGEFTNDDDRSEYVTAVFDLTPEQIGGLKDALEQCPDIEIVPRVERVVYDNPAVRKLVGEVSNTDNCMTGVSGLEAEYDHALGGVAEIYEITVDRLGRRKPETWRRLQPAQPGNDVVMPFSVDDIVNANSEKTEAKNE
ncbi:MAG: hypothetical protein AB7F40_02495 [Victivallaceae bacterium]|nr:hypothetical protein [Victivallaceae bacterium]